MSQAELATPFVIDVKNIGDSPALDVNLSPIVIPSGGMLQPETTLNCASCAQTAFLSEKQTTQIEVHAALKHTHFLNVDVRMVREWLWVAQSYNENETGVRELKIPFTVSYRQLDNRMVTAKCNLVVESVDENRNKAFIEPDTSWLGLPAPNE